MSKEAKETKLSELREEIFNLRFQQSTNQIENPLKLRTIRKDIARLKTLIHEDGLKKIKN